MCLWELILLREGLDLPEVALVLGTRCRQGRLFSEAKQV